MVRQTRWNVPTEMPEPAAGPTSSAMRSRSSFAARFVKVSARTEPASSPRDATRCATRRVSTRVLPVPGPATTRTGPKPQSTAAACCALSATGGARGGAGRGAAAAPGMRFASRIAWRWSRVFCEWHGRHSACRFSKLSDPFSATGTTWSTSWSGGRRQPQAAHSYFWRNATSFLSFDGRLRREAPSSTSTTLAAAAAAASAAREKRIVDARGDAKRRGSGARALRSRARAPRTARPRAARRSMR